MKRFATWSLLGIAMMGTSLWSGCGEKEPAKDKPAATTPPAEPAAGDKPAADTGAAVDVMNDDIEKNLANLSEEDRALVRKQKVCPVTQEPLGSMGEPIKIEKDGKAIFICCEGCKEKVEANFAEFLAKIDAGAKPAEN